MSDYQGNIIIKNPTPPAGPSTYGRAPGMWKLSEVAYWIKQGVWPDTNVVPDQYFPYVSLLLSTTSLGNANNNLFVDSSGAFNPVSRNGNTTQGSFSPYSTNWSNYTSGGYLSWTNSTGLGSNNFTIEFWGLNIAGSGNWGVFSIGATSGVDYAGITLAQNAGVYISTTGSSWQYTNIGGLTFSSDGQWHHYAIVRNGGSLLTFKDGTLIATTAISGSLVNNSGHCRIASKSDASGTMTGYISNFRVVNGTALYTASFTVPTAPLTAVTNTAILTCQSNRFRDASSNNFALTVNGSMSVTDFGPFSPTYPGAVYNQSDITNWSGYFDGSGDYLSIPSNAAFSYGTGDFTMEAWVYKAGSGAMAVVDSYTIGAGGTFGFLVNDTQVVGYQTNVGAYTFTHTVPTNSWNHIAFVRTGGNLICYVNGTSIGSQANSANFVSTQPIIIGRNAGSGLDQWLGYISNLRVVKGTAVYTGNFTPSTSNLTAISGTSLLTLQNAAFTDNSTNNFVITPFGNTTVTGNSPFNTVGYWSNYFDGSGDYINTAASSSLGLTGDWTVEGWVYQTSTAGAQIFLDTRGSGATGFGIYCSLTGYAGGPGAFGYATNSALVAVSSTVIPLNTWTHLAVTRSGNTITGYINGTSAFTYTESRTLSSTMSYFVGADYTGTSNAYGYFSNFRVVRGTAVYTGNFTPPTAPLTAIANTSLLTCQNGRFIDNSTNALTITAVGNTSVQSFDPFYTSTIASNGGSMYFDGSGDYLALQSNPSYALGSGDFTLEVWVYPIVQGGHGSSNNDCIIDFRPAANGAYGTLYSFNNGTSINWYANTGVRITGAAIPNNSWSHLCVSRVSGNTRLFINGVQSGSTYVDSTNYLQTNPWIGQFNDSVGGGWFQGYMSGMRIVKGSGVSSTFTPPTAPQTPTAATTLLLNGMNAGIYDATAINDMETVGNAQVSTVQSKFGGSSMYFDGSGDYLSIRSVPELSFGTGDFTIEAWVYITANSGDWFIISSIGSGGLFFGQRAGSGWGYGRTAVAWDYNSGVNPVTNTWQHLAISRSGTSMRMFVDGTQIGTTQSSSTDYSLATGGTSVGSQGANYYLNGYIDDFRITKGVARYTSNFTPPTQPFPVY